MNDKLLIDQSLQLDQRWVPQALWACLGIYYKTKSNVKTCMGLGFGLDY